MLSFLIRLGSPGGEQRLVSVFNPIEMLSEKPSQRQPLHHRRTKVWEPPTNKRHREADTGPHSRVSQTSYRDSVLSKSDPLGIF